ncbi:hypothetical protein C0992_003426 [Termitomyces sp. T32_za158]|nr:hypothetical protein C0992_003426 [Termitomyces sp. T32_za158]
MTEPNSNSLMLAGDAIRRSITRNSHHSYASTHSCVVSNGQNPPPPDEPLPSITRPLPDHLPSPMKTPRPLTDPQLQTHHRRLNTTNSDHIPEAPDEEAYTNNDPNLSGMETGHLTEGLGRGRPPINASPTVADASTGRGRGFAGDTHVLDPPMSSLLNAQGPLHDRTLVAITAPQNAHSIESSSPVVGQFFVSDGDNFEKDLLVRPDVHDQNYPWSRPTAFKSTLSGTWAPTPAPLSSNILTAPNIESNPPAPVTIDLFVPFTKGVANSSQLPTVQPKVQPTGTRAPPPAPLPSNVHYWHRAATTAPQVENNPMAYVAINPFETSVAKSVANTVKPQVQPTIDQMMRPGAHKVTAIPTSSYIIAFLLDTLPRQIYLYFLLTLPSLYFSRVARVFENAELSIPKIKDMVISATNDCEYQSPSEARMLSTWQTPHFPASPPFNSQVVARFKTSWEQFVDSLMEEWKTLNLVSVLLLSSIIFYLTCVMTFLWRTGTTSDTVLQITPLTALGPRLSVTFTFILGLVYLCLIIREFRRYGDTMDKTWAKRVIEWKETQRKTSDIPHGALGPYPPGFVTYPQMPPVVDPQRSDYPAKPSPPAVSVLLPQRPFDAAKILDLRVNDHIRYPMSWILRIRLNIERHTHTWEEFILDVSRAWDECFQRDSEPSSGTQPGRAAPQDAVAQVIALWNVKLFLPHRTQAVLCEEQTDEEPTPLSYTIYVIDLGPSPYKLPSGALKGEQLACKFGKVPAGVACMSLYDPVPPYGEIKKAKSRPLHIPLATSRQPDLTSWPLSLSRAWAAKSSGDDVKNSNDGDGHSERVPSLYAQPDMGFTGQEPSNDTTVSIQAAEEDNGLSPLYEQETSQEGRQLDQNNFDTEKSTPYYPEGWPNDWRSDYGSIIPGEQRPKTSVAEFKDPIQRTICKTLSYLSDLRVVYDLRFIPDKNTLCFPTLRPADDDTRFTQVATDPPVDHMRLFHPLLPWYIDVRQSQPNGVTVQDVFVQMFSQLRLQISEDHYLNTELEHGEKIAMAFERRTQGNKKEWAKGMKRVDYLEDNIVFVGLVRTDKGLWEMKTTA